MILFSGTQTRLAKPFFLSILFILGLACNSSTGQDGNNARQRHYNTKSKHLALQGYDPVSYFTPGAPLKGSKDINYNHQGIVYHFSSSENLTTFKNNPQKYEPQYGGWCAYAIGESGDKVKVNPLTYKIKDEKLYLFYDFRGTNTLTFWNNDELKLTQMADKNWKETIK